MSEWFDISVYGYSDVDLFVRDRKGKPIRCQHHEDKNPSAQVNEKGVYCFSCVTFFPFEKYSSRNVYRENGTQAQGFHATLVSQTNKSPVRGFLKNRGFPSKQQNQIITDFQLGFNDQKQAISMPIKNLNGKIVGFGYRTILESGDPKYWNSESSEYFKKKNTLYGIEKVTHDCKTLVLCEGYFDVISAYYAGINRETVVVGLMGIAFTEDHIPSIKYLIRKKNIESIVIMLDRDDSGREATYKVLKILLAADISPKIVEYPDENVGFNDCKDINDILLKSDGAQYLRELIRNAYDWFHFLLKSNIDHQVWTKKSKEEFAKECIDLISDRDLKGKYATKLCSFLKLYEARQQKDSNTYPDILTLAKANDVRDFFFQEESYFNVLLPKYFTFQPVLNWARNVKSTGTGWNDIENPNYTLFSNKDGEYSWREFQIINPILYKNMVNIVADNWPEIRGYFTRITAEVESKIKCKSLPVVNPQKKDRFSNNTARQIITWWEGIEQESIKMSLKYKYVMHTDIVDCYGSIYTHAIPWALYGKETAKNNRNDQKLLGNQIDSVLRNMNFGQTNGIPQGSVLMDFISEILLYYVDSELFKKCDKSLKFEILRYRDDYRIFANDITTAKIVVKNLSDILIDTGGMRLSTGKTQVSDCVVSGSVKPDKLDYFEKFKSVDSLRQLMFNTYLFAKKHPNSGASLRVLQLFSERLKSRIFELSISTLKGCSKEINFDAQFYIGVLAEFLLRFPRTYPIVCGMIFDLTETLPNSERKKIWDMLKIKSKDVPNNELLRIWMERTIYIHPNDTDGWEAHFNYVSATPNQTLLFKAFNNETIWKFPTDVTECPPTSNILENDVKTKLQRAKDREAQDPWVNEPFDFSELDPFEY